MVAQFDDAVEPWGQYSVLDFKRLAQGALLAFCGGFDVYGDVLI